MRQKMDHRFSLELRNYRNIYDTLDKGFRILLANQERQNEQADHIYADDIEEPGTRGHMSNIKPLLSSFKFSYAGIDCFDKDDNIEIIKANLEEYLDSNDEDALKKADFGANKNILAKLPLIVALGSKPGYADVAVKKNFVKFKRLEAQVVYVTSYL